MKIILVTFTIALVAQAQISFGASLPDNAKENFKQMMAEIKTTSEMNIKDMPDTEAFSKYKQEHLEILKLFDEKNNEVVCDAKMAGIMKRLFEFIAKVNKSESEEAKKIREIAQKNKNHNFGTMYKAGLEYFQHPEVYGDEYC